MSPSIDYDGRMQQEYIDSGENRYQGDGLSPFDIISGRMTCGRGSEAQLLVKCTRLFETLSRFVGWSVK